MGAPASSAARKAQGCPAEDGQLPSPAPRALHQVGRHAHRNGARGEICSSSHGCTWEEKKEEEEEVIGSLTCLGPIQALLFYLSVPALLLLPPKMLSLSQSQCCPGQGWNGKSGTIPLAAGSGAQGHRPVVLSNGGCRIWADTMEVPAGTFSWYLLLLLVPELLIPSLSLFFPGLYGPSCTGRASSCSAADFARHGKWT